MTSFDKALAYVLNVEKAYANVPGDPGGETVWGIARKKNPHWKGWPQADLLKTRPGWQKRLETDDQLMAHVGAFYRAEFWSRMRCDEMPSAVAFALFDMAVNCGCVQAVKALQRAIGQAGGPACSVDGSVGQEVLAGVSRCDPARLADEFLFERVGYYAELAAKSENSRKFLVGWLRRTLEVERLCDQAA